MNNDSLLPPQTSSGPATDNQGRPVLDPTRNVLDLVDAAIQRQDDLREMQAEYQRRFAELREVHSRELRGKEAERIDAIRLVDVSAVARAAEVSATQASALAAQVSASAEAMRSQVAASAAAASDALARSLDPIQKDIADLRRAQYEQQGQKLQVDDSRAKGSSIGLWIGLAVSTVFGFIGVAIGISGFIFAITGR
jgi:hypothetical protein